MRGWPISRILSSDRNQMDDHSSDDAVTNAALAANPDLLGVKHPRRIRDTRSLFGIAPGGACRAVRVATSAVGSYPTVSPFPPRARVVYISVALSLGLPPPGVTRHRALWSPDFPRHRNAAAIQPSARCPLRRSWAVRQRRSGLQGQ